MKSSSKKVKKLTPKPSVTAVYAEISKRTCEPDRSKFIEGGESPLLPESKAKIDRCILKWTKMMTCQGESKQVIFDQKLDLSLAEKPQFDEYNPFSPNPYQSLHTILETTSTLHDRKGHVQWILSNNGWKYKALGVPFIHWPNSVVIHDDRKLCFRILLFHL